MKFRFSKEEDNEQLFRIAHAFFEFNPYKAKGSAIDEDSLFYTFQDLRSKHILLVAEVDDKIVGAAAAYIAPVFWNMKEKQGVEAFWWIDPEHRAGGNGKKLRQALERVAKSRGVKYWSMISLELAEPEKMKVMYAKAGFEHIENVFLKVL